MMMTPSYKKISKYLLFRLSLFGLSLIIFGLLIVNAIKQMPPKEALAVVGTLVIPSTTSTFTSTNIVTTKLTIGGADVTVSAADINKLAGIGSSSIATQLALKAPLASPAFTGNVGIGTTSPNEKLEVISRVSIADNSTANRKSLLLMNPGYAGHNYAEIGAYDYGASSLNLVLAGPTTNGNVGIGTTNPGSLLEVAGTMRLKSGTSNFTFRPNNTGSGDLTLYNETSGQYAMVINSGGKITVGTSSGTNPKNTLDIYGNSAIGTTYSGYTAPANSLIVEGSVGIGTTNPQTKLSIVDSTVPSIRLTHSCLLYTSPSPRD